MLDWQVLFLHYIQLAVAKERCLRDFGVDTLEETTQFGIYGQLIKGDHLLCKVFVGVCFLIGAFLHNLCGGRLLVSTYFLDNDPHDCGCFGLLLIFACYCRL
jgi:hypothetical protein